MRPATIYTDAYSGYEILCLEGKEGYYGAAYDPRRASSLVAWASNCSHCREHQRHYHLPLVVRRHVEMLASARKIGGSIHAVEYDVPSLKQEHTVRHWTTKDRAVVVVSDGKSSYRIEQTLTIPRVTTSTGDDTPFRHLHIVPRAMSFLLCSRAALPHEISACARPLSEEQAARKKRPGYRKVCDKIDWSSLLEESSHVAA